MAKTREQQDAFDKIESLVEHFHNQIDRFKKFQNETETRVQFINPLFAALGWDVDNTIRKAIDADRDVVHEDRLTIKGKSKAPDYSFRVFGERKFFLEAKKPSIAIKTDTVPSYQLRRYGWSAKLPISVLTDFEEFALYDCTKQPKETDSAAIGRLKYIPYHEYTKEFDWLWDLFSREQVLKGSLDQFAKADKKGTQSVDYSFLNSLDEWRNFLATSIALRNPMLDEDEINYVVQMNINRIVFLRNCEDRGVEPYGRLKECIENSKEEGAYFRNMYRIFEDADRKYNSGLFDFSKDNLTQSVQIDNKVIGTIVGELYYPKSPYEFSVIGAEILGTAYERFLGKVIRLTAGHRAKVEEKPEVRKAGGVFYTPYYIVEYIVKNTVGKLIENKTPDEISRIKICDPACGSGSFLIGAYEYLLDYHLHWYNANYKKGRNAKDSPLTPDGNLTSQVKKQILLNNIYGVDIDAQAVEVTKLSLLMKCMEGESQATMQTTLTFERVLPTLDNNIKSGNSLIDFDFYEGQLDFGEDKKIKPFNWKQGFPEVFKQGGFNAIIGNPPYVKVSDAVVFGYFNKIYKYQDYQQDLYLLFLERYHFLLINKGKLGIIIPNTWLQSIKFRNIRKYLVTQYYWERFLNFKNRVFDAIVDTHVLVFEKNDQLKNTKTDIEIYENGAYDKLQTINQDALPQNGDVINIVASETEKLLFDKIKSSSITVGEVCFSNVGVKPFQVGKGNPKQTKEIVDKKPFVVENCPKPVGTNWQPLMRGSLMNKYVNFWNNDSWIQYGEWLAEPRDPRVFEADEKIIVRQTGDSIIATIIGKNIVCRNNLHVLISDSISHKFILGMLNSKLTNFYYYQINPERGEALAEVKKNHVTQLPVPKTYTQIQYDEIVKNVELLLKLNAELQNETNIAKKEQMKGRIAYAEQRINEIVYELYNLTPEEIKIVEGQ